MAQGLNGFGSGVSTYDPLVDHRIPHRVRVYGCGSRPSRPVVAPGPPASSTGSCGSGSASSTVHRPPRQERGRLVGCWRASNWASKVGGRRQAEQSNAPSSSSSTADPGCCQAAEAATVTQLESGRTGTVLCARHDPRLASKMLDGVKGSGAVCILLAKRAS